MNDTIGGVPVYASGSCRHCGKTVRAKGLKQEGARYIRVRCRGCNRVAKADDFVAPEAHDGW